MEDRSENVMWFVAGVALGATIALLYAPASGKVVRKKIVKQADKATEAISDTGRDIYGRGKELYEKGKQMADEAADLFERGRKMVQG
jgi:gas vesicle protein